MWLCKRKFELVHFSLRDAHTVPFNFYLIAPDGLDTADGGTVPFSFYLIAPDGLDTAEGGFGRARPPCPCGAGGWWWQAKQNIPRCTVTAAVRFSVARRDVSARRQNDFSLGSSVIEPARLV